MPSVKLAYSYNLQSSYNHHLARCLKLIDQYHFDGRPQLFDDSMK